MVSLNSHWTSPHFWINEYHIGILPHFQTIRERLTLPFFYPGPSLSPSLPLFLSPIAFATYLPPHLLRLSHPRQPTRLPHSSSLSACPSSLIKPWRLSAKRTSPSALDIYEHYELDGEGHMKDTDRWRRRRGGGWKRRCTVCRASIISCRF